MVMNPHIFRKYDIRGIANTDITPRMAYCIGLAFGSFLRRKYQCRSCTIAVGEDNRPSSPDLSEAVCRGLTETGCNVWIAGLTPSPLLCFAVAHRGIDGGINVTASHNPPDQNGFKLSGREAYPIAEDDIHEIRKIIETGNYISGHGTVDEIGIFQEYFLQLSKLLSFKSRVKVVVDTGNGVAGLIVPSVLRLLGCDVVELYCELDSRFPNHPPNPEKAENVRDLQQKVIDTGADIGLAFDGDGDRLGVVNEKGERYDADKVLILLSRDLLGRYPAARIMMDVKSSQSVIDDIADKGGVPILWKTGHSLIKRQLHQDRDILLAGEYSGHMFPVENYYLIDDALLAACRLIQYMCQQGKTLSGLLGSLPDRHSTGLIEVGCADESKSEVVAAITKSLESRYKVNTIDGARVALDGGWALVRASNTGPNLTLRFEADTERQLEQIQSIIYEELGRYPAVDL